MSAHRTARKQLVNCILSLFLTGILESSLAQSIEGSLESFLHLSFSPVSMSYVVNSKIKEFINGKGMMSSGDLSEHASKMLEWSLSQAVQRATANGRKTVRGEDLAVIAKPSDTGYIVASAVKTYVNGKGMMSSGDLAQFASGMLEWLLGQASQRAAANGRKTVRGEDLAFMA
jgi:histone H3/H4